MQSVLQRHIDQAISSTINLPKDTSLETVERIYRMAWEQGLKGVTVYREGSREGILLTEKQAKKTGGKDSPGQSHAATGNFERSHRTGKNTVRHRFCHHQLRQWKSERTIRSFRATGKGRLGSGSGRRSHRKTSLADTAPSIANDERREG